MPTYQHIVQVVLFLGFVVYWVSSDLQLMQEGRRQRLLRLLRVTWFMRGLYYFTHLLTVLGIPRLTANILGIVLYDPFKVQKVQSKGRFRLYIRIFTKGSYRQLVSETVKHNLAVCQKENLRNYKVQLVTNTSLNLRPRSNFEEIVVPSSYRTQKDTRFKARSLQYMLETSMDSVQEEDWILHLDEETLLTPSAIHGVLKFCLDGQRSFGTGMTTYVDRRITNWFTTVFDSYRVGSDLSVYQFVANTTGLPLLGWKGTFNVARQRALLDVTFDFGPEKARKKRDVENHRSSVFLFLFHLVVGLR